MRHAEQDIAQVLEGIGIPYTLPMIAPVIRSGRPGDTAAVVALLHETFEDTWRPELTPSAIAAYYGDRVAERFVEERVRTFLVADAGGEVAGMISREGGFIDALHVGARFRRRGIGRALVEAAEVAMRAEGVLRLARALRTQLDWYDEPWSPPPSPS